MTLAEARAIFPELIVEPASPAQDEQRREELARWLVRYTPLSACDFTDKDSILLDVTGCPHLFGGEQAMLATIKERLGQAGFTAQLAMAENRAVAWALSHYRPDTISRSSTESKRLLSPLPMRALRVDNATEQTLGRLGLKTIGNLFDIARPALAQRFRGKPAKQVTALLTRFDQLLGRCEEPFSPLVPLPGWRVQQAFSEPVMHLPMIEATVESLLGKLVDMLAEAEEGLRRLSLQAFRVDGSVQDIVVGTNRPSRDKKHLFSLLMEKLDQLEAEFGFDLLMLSAVETESLPPTHYGGYKTQQQQSASELLDRLAIRLGPGAISRLKHRSSHMPERAQSYAPPHARELQWGALPTSMGPRPLRLLHRPEAVDVLAEVPEGAPRRFRWRRMEHHILKADGPERIAPEWWLDPEGQTRDYYRVETIEGARFWLFRYGLYPVPGIKRSNQEGSAKPAWYMHGFFA